MKKKHYTLLADALRATRPADDWNDIAQAHRNQWEKDVCSVAAYLLVDNPRTFDKALFLTNAGVK